MRGLALALCVACTGALLACGGKETAKDPSDVPAPAADEAPKWEGAAPAPEATTPKSSGAAVQEAPKRRSDEYDKENTDVVLRRAARQVKDNCGLAKDENGKAIGPWGKVTIQVQLGHNGHSQGTTIPAPFQGKPTGKCVEKAFTNLQFPPWAGADTTVDWDVELIEPASDKK
jgi:pyruvate/2-oxoglutarate dehydrogenase complex dihydrolipoamide acyltransferase (E2) component